MKIDGQEYRINRDNCVIRDWDKVYCELLKKILKEGELFENRTGIDTLSVEGVSFKLNVGEEFPVLESKKVALHNALSEMLWIYQVQSNDVRWLLDRGNKIWNEWMIDEDGIYRTYEPEDKVEYDPDKEVQVYDLDGNVMIGVKAKSKIPGKTIKSAKCFGKEYAYTIGTAYGWINNKFKRPQYVQHKLKTEPHDRRMLISMWQDEYLKTAVLPSCVWSSEWKVKDGKLHAFVHQRSADVPLGLPFNISQYAILQAMFAKAAGLQIGNLNWSIMDAHIYVNQIEGIKTQLSRYENMIGWQEYIRVTPEDVIESKLDELIQKEQYLQTKIDHGNTRFESILKEAKEDIMVLKMMLTKEKSVLELADYDDIFMFDNHVNNDKEYLKENVTGNKDIKVLKYKSLPFIKMPIAQ